MALFVYRLTQYSIISVCYYKLKNKAKLFTVVNDRMAQIQLTELVNALNLEHFFTIFS